MRHLWLAAAVMMATALPAISAKEDSPSVWEETGFDRIGVQTGGLEKTLATFARDSLRQFTLRRHIRGEDRITLTLTLIAHPGMMAERRLIPVEGDPIIPLLEEAGVDVEERAIRLGDCLRFDPQTGRIIGEGPAMGVARHAAINHEEGSPLYSAGVRLLTRINALVELTSSLRVFPDPNEPEGRWYTLGEAQRLNVPGTAQMQSDLHALLAANAEGDIDAVRPLAMALVEGLPTLDNYTSPGRLAIDHAYTTKRPYFWASFAYVVSAVLFFVALVSNGNRWWLSAMVVMSLGWIIHMLGATARGYLLGRMPLSNLYEATTTGLAFVILLTLVLEGIYRMRIVGMCSAFLSFAYYRWLLSSDQFGNDAIEPLRAVLNSYWLDYHVTCMMLSYGAFTISFAMAAFYLLRSHMPRLMAWSPGLEELDLYTHRSIQFGWPLLGLGVVLGAVWADTAWGRMWSWDPKETWSLITWLIYTAYLHVRLVHGWKGRVMAWSSLAGYAAVLFTYLGVNFILSGLHSYAGNAPVATTGFMAAAKQHWMLITTVSVIVIAGLVWAVNHRRQGAAARAKG